MPLRDFERVRERIEIRLEIRHIAQIAVGSVALLALAFGAGWWVASSQHEPVAEQQRELAGVDVPALPAPRSGLADRRTPILPRPVPTKARQPKLARVFEAIVRDEPLPSATAAQRQDEPVHSEVDENPFEHVAVDRPPSKIAQQAAPRPAATADREHPHLRMATRRRAVLPGVIAGQVVDAAPDSPTLHPPEGWAEIPLRQADLVSSLPRVVPEAVSSLNPERQRWLQPPDLHLTSGIAPDGAALATLLDAIGETGPRSMVTGMSADDVRSLRQWQLAERRKVLEQFAREEAEKLRLVQLKAEQERLAAEKAEQDRLAAERAEQERIAAEHAEKARIAAEKERIAAEKVRVAAEKAEAKRLAALQAEQERIAAAKAKAETLAQQKAEKLARQQAEKARLAAMKAERAKLAREKAARLAEAARQKKAEAAARAKVQAAAPAKAPAKVARKVAKKAVDERAFFLQIKAFRNLSEARTFVKLLVSRGHKPRVSRITVPQRGEFHRVRIGPFKNLDRAKAAQRKFEAREPYETMIMSK